MAYNRENILKRMIKVQDITLEHTRKGVTQEWVYKNVIYPTFLLSRATYYNYLAYPAKRELRRLEEGNTAQLKLF